MSAKTVPGQFTDADAGWVQMAALNLASQRSYPPYDAVDAALELWRLTRTDVLVKRLKQLTPPPESV